MDISNKLRAHFAFSAAGVMPFPETRPGYLNHSASASASADADADAGIGCGAGAVDRFPFHVDHAVATPTWRIDGCVFGTTYWATPLSLLPHLPPLRIDVVIPDQLDWAPELWAVLDASESVHIHDQRAAGLGISRYLLLVLQRWSCDYPDFEQVYRALPFGSSITVGHIGLDLSEIRVQIRPNRGLQRHLLSLNTLQQWWNFQGQSLPTAIGLRELRFVRRLCSSICLIDHGGERMIFKSNTRSPSSIYHEIKVLLSLPPHPNIIGPPRGLVTMPSDSGDKGNLVCGFLHEYYELGSMETFLPQARKNHCLRFQDQVRWSLELASALSHIHSQPGMFYSDLKMDNVLLREIDGKISIVLVDFEQSRNLYTWAPPEVFYVEFIAELAFRGLARSECLTEQMMAGFREVIERYFVSRRVILPLQLMQLDYDNPDHGWYYPWLTSTPKEQDAGAVYCLGRAFWCIFEGVGDTSNVLGRSLSFDSDSEHEFPTFTHRTPESVQEFIKKCTSGAKEWTEEGPLGLFRRRGKVYPRGRTGVNGEPLATMEETKEAIKNVWEREIAKAKALLAAREKYAEGIADGNDLKLLGYLERPTLQDALVFFKDFQTVRRNEWPKIYCVS
ncbi:hypothetical protein G7Y89_g5996 [Cudoniella acicularis]|uniref:Protein kinase domain-containing protein n=1 Tax=Cudoniella acicularis TaxID=354080 RepID=A0A8H4RNM0_9HELO|nr:hypothetical protein G7Y89_g5996 [Cudoniella acicularis]